jgi:signal transduction histidine kinase
MFRPPPFWVAYRWYLAGGGIAFVVVGALMLGLRVNRARLKRAEHEAKRFETLISKLAKTFCDAAPGDFDRQMSQSLRLVVDELDLDWASLLEFDCIARAWNQSLAWCRPQVPPQPACIPEGKVPWITAELSAGRVVAVSGLKDLPNAIDRDTLVARGARSAVAIPILNNPDLRGAVVFATASRARTWSHHFVEQLRIFSEIISIAFLKRDLETAVRESGDRLQRERLELAHAHRVSLLGEFTSGLAHEINQPLAAIVANAQAAEMMLATGRARRAVVGEAVTDIAADARRASQVIARLRAMLRNDTPVRVPIDIAACAAETVDFAFRKLRDGGITVHQSSAVTNPVMGDPVQLQQVFLNLIVNACEAIHAARDGAREISISTAAAGVDRLEVAVRDTGVGFGDEDLERMFEHFVSTKPSGLGMGLAICRSIVKAHGGRIWATRNDDRGMTFHVELPSMLGSGRH